MNHIDKHWHREEVKEVLGIKNVEWRVLEESTVICSIFEIPYFWLIIIEIYRGLLRFGCPKEKIDGFIKSVSINFLEKEGELTRGDVKVDLEAIRARVDKKIAAWEQSKKPVEQKMNPYEQACKEWMKGCSCSREMSPADCYSCTAAFLEHVQKIIEKE